MTLLYDLILTSQNGNWLFAVNLSMIQLEIFDRICLNPSHIIIYFMLRQLKRNFDLQIFFQKMEHLQLYQIGL